MKQQTQESKALAHFFFSVLFCLTFISALAQHPGAGDPTFNVIDNISIGNGLGANSRINTSCLQPDGQIIVGGKFTNYSAIPKNRIARLNTDGNLDTTFNRGAGSSGEIIAISLQPDGKIIIGGSFSSYDNIPRQNIARLHPDGRLDFSFNPGTGTDGPVRAITFQTDGKIIIAGDFTDFNGFPIKNIVRLNADGSHDQTFVPAKPSQTVRSLNMQPDGKIIIGGDFSVLNGKSIKGIARLNTDGSIDDTFNPGSGNGVDGFLYKAERQPDGKIIIAGIFNEFNGMPISSIARLHEDGDLDTSFNSSISNGVGVKSFLVQPSGKIIIAGDVYSNGNQNSALFYRLNEDGQIDSTFDVGNGPDDNVLTILQLSNGKIFAGGNFRTFNNLDERLVACLFSDGSVDTTFSHKPNGTDNNVLSIGLQSDGKIIIGGSFSVFNRQLSKRLARLNQDGSLDTTFNIGTGFNQRIETIAIQNDGKILVGGIFSTFNGIPINNITRLNSDGSLDTTFNTGTGTDDIVQTICLQADGKVIIGGNFSSYNGKVVNHIARLNSNGSLDSTFITGSGFDDLVLSSFIQNDGKILIGGIFSAFRGNPRKGIARLNTDGSLDATFNPGFGFNGFVITIDVQTDGKIILGGQFSAFNGLSINKIIRLFSDGRFDNSFNIGTGIGGVEVNAVKLQPDGKILVGGDFTTYNNTPVKNMIRLQSDGSLDACFVADSSFVVKFEVKAVALQPDKKIVIGLKFFNFTVTNKNGVDRLLGEGMFASTDVVQVCDNKFTWIDGNTYTNSTNTPTFMLTNSNGCDSLVTLNLTFTSTPNFNTTLDVQGEVLTAQEQGASYQWIDCANGNTPIFGATQQSYTATVNGQYGVIISKNGCVVTSDCATVLSVSVQDLTTQAAIHLYPNPAKDELQVVLPSGAIHITAHSLHDVLGRAVAAPAITNTNSSYSLSVKSLSPGIYFLRLHLNNGQTVVKKVWKE